MASAEEIKTFLENNLPKICTNKLGKNTASKKIIKLEENIIDSGTVTTFYEVDLFVNKFSDLLSAAIDAGKTNKQIIEHLRDNTEGVWKNNFIRWIDNNLY